MPYQKRLHGNPDGSCTICGSPANILRNDFGVGTVVNCSCCGDYRVDHVVADDVGLPLRDERKALACYLIRRMQQHNRAVLDREFFTSLHERSLPSPAEITDNLLLFVADRAQGRPGIPISIDHQDPVIAAAIGAFNGEDVLWATNNLEKLGWLGGGQRLNHYANGYLTGIGWARVEELKRAHIASRYAFFARKFANPELDAVYEKCLLPAVRETNYDLRTVSQKAGHIDAIIEDEIRRCKFLIADLSDGNAGAYWEAGFAEGLRKPVIYICRSDIETHFDTDHRQTVRWDLTKLDETAARLKAVIRNTLLDDAKQND